MNNFKMLVLIVSYFATLSLHAGPLKSSHELFELNVGHGEGTFVKSYLKVTSLDLYEAPSEDAKILYSVALKQAEDNHPVDFLKLFNDKSGVFFFQGIYSKEKKGKFYKVFYKGNYYWAHEKSFYRITKIENLMMEGGLHIPVEKSTFYDAPAGSKMKVPKSLLDFSKLDKNNGMAFKILSYKWVKSKLWIQLTNEDGPCTEGTTGLYKEKIIFWVHPYDKDNRPLYNYPHNGC